MRTCEICGERIRTGRKYCWRHRNSAETEEYRSMKKLNKAYFRYRIRKIPSTKILSIASIILIVLGIVLTATQNSIAYFLVGMALCLIIAFFGSRWQNSVINKEIYTRSPAYLSFAKMYGEVAKEEREFRKSIFR